MPDITIRRAAAADAPTVIELVKALADYEHLDPPDAATQARFAVDLSSEHPRFEAYLAEDRGKAIGYSIIFETYSSFLALPTLYIEDIFVLPEYRGRGAGGALFKEIVEEARKRGYGRLEWTVLDWNTTAQEFYRKMGGQQLKAWQLFRLAL